ncbi:tripartite tricarboxylate transporter TctB family protein [Caproiciproducens sp. NJN-50]|uniref:tripartite tricarboxylate transporter TctB family protein n=1 Tax=Acutalibacteraceae TaxID=3082771 RepID=UPI000FFE2DEE|nr:MULTISPECIES: tripartite tricarboxylate transporter TctB family protein [Acutalibacteraceae]QAT48928.1 tripartite tricarboxylate transporter TctB family protein [Caproiciproducens sp. NJN-50]
MKMKLLLKKKDSVLGLFCVLLGIIVFAGSLSLSSGAAFFPKITAAVIAVLGVLIFADALKEGEVQPAAAEAKVPGVKEEKKAAAPEYKKVALILGLLFAYCAALQWVGYIIPTILFVLACSFTLNYRKVKVILIAAACLSIGLYFMFSMGFNVRFPGLF